MSDSPTQYHYEQFPPKYIDWNSLVRLIGFAHAALARYDATLAVVPNSNILLSPLTTQEAVLSSRIEGTQATMGEVLEYEAGADIKQVNERREGDINEVLNYRQGMRKAVDLLEKLPLCQRVVKEAHKTLLQGVRGQGRDPGGYRKIQNWIGAPGCSIEDARYIPISTDKLETGLREWENFMNEDYPDRLVQLALVHAEFEALHPFLDGNGRLGRMLVPLFMYQSKLIQSPVFYISEFFERHRDEYYEKLLGISKDNDWTAWCAFFLQAVAEQAASNQGKAIAILKLYEKKKSAVIPLTRSQYAIHALDFIFSRPIFKSSDFIQDAGIPKPTATRILALLRDERILSILREASGRRPAVYAFVELLDIVEG